ncbi:hypothetical protein DB32_007548 [Sandaracinus amylolyticus]|uniref:HTH cro/C1-type domain-containing protein n=2 Tax=Sandaracinus amylolyticus TaxID=927083 RepID=A0A0F6SHG4_9BACT|nr:hypothetical protein DB32_007548 [Sandaracinus amylolyticus]
MTFPDALWAARESLRLEQRELGALIGVATRTIARWEHGDALPRGNVRSAIVAAIASRDAARAKDVAVALDVPVPTPQPPPDQAPKVEALDAAVYLAADALGVPAAAARPVLARFLLHLAASRISLDEARAKLKP